MKITPLQLLVLTVPLFTLPSQAADPPHLIPFQGHLARPSATDPTRFEPVPSGRYDILFTLYAGPVGGESKVWGPERHPQITVVNGLLNALLGSVLGFENALTSQPNFFRRPLYVGTTKARDADLFDGIDATAVFVDPANTANPKVKTARVADAISGALTVQGLLSSWLGAEEFFMVPRGAIIIWSGNTLPNGWVLCDGQGGTPDLRDKFVRGAPGLGPYARGGSDTHTHTSPAHLHSVDPPARATGNNSGGGFTAGNTFVSQQASRHTHTHTVDIPAFDSPSTSVSIDSAANVPEHFSLAYIMKL